MFKLNIPHKIIRDPVHLPHQNDDFITAYPYCRSKKCFECDEMVTTNHSHARISCNRWNISANVRQNKKNILANADVQVNEDIISKSWYTHIFIYKTKTYEATNLYQCAASNFWQPANLKYKLDAFHSYVNYVCVYLFS